MTTSSPVPVLPSPPTSTKKSKRRQRKPVSELRKSIDTNRQGQEGVAWVRWIVEGMWGCGLEVVSASNDDGVDAIILLKRRPGLERYAGPTGDLLFVQIKTGYVTSTPTADYALSFDPKKLAIWRAKWSAYPGPTVMINVIPRRHTGKDPIAYWANLKDPANNAAGKVSFSLKNCFDSTAKSSFYNLCWRWAELRKLPVLYLDKTQPAFPGEPSMYYLGPETLLEATRNYFKEWKKASLARPNDFQALITWRGWEHLTRKERAVRTKQQSLMLLPAAARILLNSNDIKPISVQKMKPLPAPKHPNGETRSRGYEALTARVIFNERQEAVVRVVTERTKLFRKDILIAETVTFYSVYEVARRKRNF